MLDVSSTDKVVDPRVFGRALHKSTWSHPPAEANRTAHCRIIFLMDVQQPLTETWTCTKHMSAICIQNVDVHVSCSSHCVMELALFFIHTRAKWSSVKCCFVVSSTMPFFFGMLTIYHNPYRGTRNVIWRRGSLKAKLPPFATLVTTTVHSTSGRAAGEHKQPSSHKRSAQLFGQRQASRGPKSAEQPEIVSFLPLTKHRLHIDNDPSKGSPAETLLRLLLPLSATVLLLNLMYLQCPQKKRAVTGK